MKGLDELFCRYRRLIGYAANQYRYITVVDPEDLFQDGCLFLLEFFHTKGVIDQVTEGCFRKSLFLYLSKLVSRTIRASRPNGRTMMHFKFGSSDDEGSVDLDAILAVADTSILVKLYAREFTAEMRRLLHGVDRDIFEELVESINDDVGRNYWVKAVVGKLSISRANVYLKLQKIRSVALRVLNHVAA